MNGQPAGRWAEELSSYTDWTRIWVVFLAPESDKDLNTLYPALVTGYGKVWIDDVRLVELPGVQQ